MTERSPTVTGGRPATSGVIPGRYALSVGNPRRGAPPGWAWTALTDVARLESGHTPSRRHSEYWDGAIPWIGIRDATENHGRVLHDTEQHVTQEGIDHSSARVLPANTVCLSRTASIGYVVVMGRPMATSQDFVNWVCGPRIDARFLKYVLLAERESFAMFASGTTHQTIYFPEVKAFHVCLPPLEEQRRIVGILSSLDDKIELNRRTSETLEVVARAIFKSWFIDDAPAGWTVCGLDEVARFLNGLALQRFPPTADGSLPVIKIAQLRSGDTRDADRASADLPADYVVRDGDVLFSWSGSLECVIWAGGQGALNQHLFKVTSADFPKWFYYLWIHQHLPDFREIAAGKATTMGHIQRHHLADAKVSVPPLAVLASADRVLGPMTDQISMRTVEARTLAGIRDALLPRLLSGELNP